MAKNDKKERQEAIAQILSRSAIDSQDELLHHLSLLGFEPTQATLSRDFREMKVAKTPDAAGNYVYRLPSMQLPPSPRDKHGMVMPFLRQGTLNIEFSGQVAVIKTPPGYARGIACDIESNNIPGIMGAIPADNTLMLLLRPTADKEIILQSLKILFVHS